MKLRFLILIVALCWGVSSQAQQLPIVKYDIDKVTAKWNDMEARLTIDADYPDGNTPAARTLQRWLYELFISRHFNGQTITGKQLMERVEANFREANSVEEMKRFAEDGAEEGNWFFNYRVKKEYESVVLISLFALPTTTMSPVITSWAGPQTAGELLSILITDCLPLPRMRELTRTRPMPFASLSSQDHLSLVNP